MSYPDTPPERASIDPTHPDFHPSCRRIAIVFDGEELTDVVRYDAIAGVIFRRGAENSPVVGKVEPSWRWAEARQERRARERWDRNHRAGTPK